MDDEKDLFIKQKLQEDKLISKKSEDIFNNIKKEDFFMEEKFKKENYTKENIKNSVKKVTKWRKMLAIAASLIIIMGAANVYASTNGYGNVFFLIKYLITGNKETIEGKDAILSDRDITISYETIKLTENVGMQIRNFKIKENEATLTLVVHEENIEVDKTLVPLSYKVYNSENKVICNQISVKANNQNLSEYTEELRLNDYKQEDNVIVLEIYKSNNEKIARFTINLNTREIVIEGEEEALQKVSEIELKKYLGFISAYEEKTIKSDNDGKIHFAEAILSSIKNVKPYQTNNGNAYKVEDVNGILESIGYEKVDEIFKKGELFQRKTINSTEYFDVLSGTEGFNPNTVIEIMDISYCAGLYTAKFSYANIMEDESFSIDYSKVDKKIATAYFKVNEYDKYSKFKIVKYVKGKDEVSSIQENNTENKEENNLQHSENVIVGNTVVSENVSNTNQTNQINTNQTNTNQTNTNNTNSVNTNTTIENSTQTNSIVNNPSESYENPLYKRISKEMGQWQYYTAFKNDIANRIYKKVGFEEIFGEDYIKNPGRLIFSPDGKFSGNLPMVSNEHIGTYTIDENGGVLLKFGIQNIKLEYVKHENEASDAIRQIYGNYEIIIRRNGYKSE